MRLLGTTRGPFGRDFYLRGGGAAETFRIIIRIIQHFRPSQSLGRLAVGIVRGIADKDLWGEARAVFDWLRRWKYVKDPHGRELLHTPPRILKHLRLNRTIRDCDDFTILGASLMLQLGHPVQLRMVGPTPRGFTHIYFAVRLPTARGTRWVPLDATNKTEPMGWEPPHAIMQTYTF